MDERTLIEAIDRQPWLEPAGDAAQKAVAAALDELGQPAEDFLHGTWIGHPLHAVLTDVPIGAWTTAFVLDVLESAGHTELAAGADTAVGMGLIGALGAAATGLADWRYAKGRRKRLGTAHAACTGTATLLYLASWALRKHGSRLAAKGLSTLGFAAMNAGAWLGGHLGYGEQMGVDHTHDNKPPINDFTPVMKDADLPSDTPARADAGDTPLLLVRKDDGIFALRETCAHMGGPLSKGELKGDAIICPWHGSCFDVRDGSLQCGPSVYPQPHFETRVRDGMIEVRKADPTAD